MERSLQQLSATRAKQNFGELLRAAALAPVAIERHGKIQAVVAAPGFFVTSRADQDPAALRRLARLGQALVEKDRLIRHQRIALNLLSASVAARQAMVERAQAVVARWQKEQLCSAEYIERWSAILRLPATEMAIQMTTDANEWGPALRQNSPWVGVFE